MMFASGAMPNMTPRQTAGADGPKSVRNVMTGRTMSAGADAGRRADGRAQPRRGVGLVVGEADPAEGVLEQQRSTNGHPPEGLLPGGPLGQLSGAVSVQLNNDAPAWVQGADRTGQVGRLSGKADVAEAVDEEYGRPKLAIGHLRRWRGQPDQGIDRDFAPDFLERGARREVR